MLQQLSKHHDEILKAAVKITGNLETAKDVVQDCYIKLYDSGKTFEEINFSYIYFTLKSIYTDSVKESTCNNRIVIKNDFSDITDEVYEQMSIEFKNITRWEKLVIDAVCGRLITNVDNEIIKHIKGVSISELSRKTGINYSILYRTVKNLKTKVWLKELEM
jgi:hypothetical protein